MIRCSPDKGPQLLAQHQVHGAAVERGDAVLQRSALGAAWQRTTGRSVRHSVAPQGGRSQTMQQQGLTDGHAGAGQGNARSHRYDTINITPQRRQQPERPERRQHAPPAHLQQRAQHDDGRRGTHAQRALHGVASQQHAQHGLQGHSGRGTLSSGGGRSALVRVAGTARCGEAAQIQPCSGSHNQCHSHSRHHHRPYSYFNTPLPLSLPTSQGLSRVVRGGLGAREGAQVNALFITHRSIPTEDLTSHLPGAHQGGPRGLEHGQSPMPHPPPAAQISTALKPDYHLACCHCNCQHVSMIVHHCQNRITTHLPGAQQGGPRGLEGQGGRPGQRSAAGGRSGGWGARHHKL